jgi:multidrug efflux pump subunit AcrA (membrane-fusion protein)
VAPAGQVTQAGGVSYRVTIDIEPGSAPLRAGMSATATIISTTRENVLLVPNRAVQLDRTSGRTFVERLTPDGPQKTEIRLGLRDEQHSEVRAGLEDGDRLIIRSVSSRELLQQTFSGF